MNPRKKRKLMITLICLGTVLFIAMLVTVFLNRQARKKAREVEISQTSSTDGSSESYSSQSYREPTPNEKNYQQARATLERPESVVTEEKKNKVAEALKIAVEDIKKHPDTANISGNMDNRLASTSSPMVLTFAMAINLAGYNIDESKTEVFKSYSDDVLQFLCVMTKEGKENSYFVGNYNDYTGQLQIASYHGGNIRVRGD